MTSLRHALEALSPAHEGIPAVSGVQVRALSVRAGLAHFSMAAPDPAQRTPRRLAEFIAGASAIKSIGYNTMLMVPFYLHDLLPGPLKAVTPNVKLAPKPAFTPREAELVGHIEASGYDVAMLSEVFHASTRTLLSLRLQPMGYAIVNGPAETAELIPVAMVKRMLEHLPGNTLKDVAKAVADAVDWVSGALDTLTFGLFGKAGDAVNMKLVLLSSGLTTVTRKRVVYRQSVEFKERGELFLDLDSWSNKGANGLVIDSGVTGSDGRPGHIIFISTHLFNGGFTETPDDQNRRYGVQSKQIGQIKALLHSLRLRYPEAPWVITGDFNIAGSSGNYAKFADLLDFGADGDSIDLWGAVSRDIYGLRQGHTTFGDRISKKDGISMDACRTDAAAEGFCYDAAGNGDGEANRIDYVFVSRHRPEFNIRIVPSRIRRRFFPRVETSADYADCIVGSDHIGLEFNLLTKAS